MHDYCACCGWNFKFCRLYVKSYSRKKFKSLFGQNQGVVGHQGHIQGGSVLGSYTSLKQTNTSLKQKLMIGRYIPKISWICLCGSQLSDAFFLLKQGSDVWKMVIKIPKMSKTCSNFTKTLKTLTLNLNKIFFCTSYLSRIKHQVQLTQSWSSSHYVSNQSIKVSQKQALKTDDFSFIKNKSKRRIVSWRESILMLLNE